jgi:hypothetical protein
MRTRLRPRHLFAVDHRGELLEAKRAMGESRGGELCSLALSVVLFLEVER